MQSIYNGLKIGDMVVFRESPKEIPFSQYGFVSSVSPLIISGIEFPDGKVSKCGKYKL